MNVEFQFLLIWHMTISFVDSSLIQHLSSFRLIEDYWYNYFILTIENVTTPIESGRQNNIRDDTAKYCQSFSDEHPVVWYFWRSKNAIDADIQTKIQLRPLLIILSLVRSHVTLLARIILYTLFKSWSSSRAIIFVATRA